MIYSIVIECFNITTEIDFSALKLALLKVFVNRIERVAKHKYVQLCSFRTYRSVPGVFF